jgi:hypothetical protein
MWRIRCHLEIITALEGSEGMCVSAALLLWEMHASHTTISAVDYSKIIG